MSHSLGMQHGSILASMSNPLPPPHGLLVIAGDYEAMSMSVWPPDSKTTKLTNSKKHPPGYVTEIVIPWISLQMYKRSVFHSLVMDAKVESSWMPR